MVNLNAIYQSNTVNVLAAYTSDSIMETLLIAGNSLYETISSQASNEEGSTTILYGVHSSEWK